MKVDLQTTPYQAEKKGDVKRLRKPIIPIHLPLFSAETNSCSIVTNGI